MAWELTFLRWVVEKTQVPFITEFFKLLTLGGEMAAIFFIGAFIMLFFKKTRKTAIVALIGLVFVAGLNHFVLKPIFNRARPFNNALFDAGNVDAIFLRNYIDAFGAEGALNKFLVPDSLSFMSGHTLSAFIFGTTVAIYHKKWAIPALILSVLMSYSRIYFGFHYPTDVIAGLITGVATSFGLAFLANKYEHKAIELWHKMINKLKRNKSDEEDNAA